MKNFFVLFLFVLGSAHAQNAWTNTKNNYPSIASVNEIAVAPNGDIYICGSHINMFNQGVPDLIKSTNGGSSWQTVNLGNSLGIGYPSSIIFCGNTLLMAGKNPAGSASYVYTSTDFGASWTQSSTGINTAYGLNDFALAPNGDIYLSARLTNSTIDYPRLLRSNTNGLYWTDVSMTGLPNTLNPVAIIFSPGGKLFMAGFNGVLSNYLYSSTNNGSTWTSSNNGIPTSANVDDFAVDNLGNVYAVATDYNSSSLVFTPKLYRTLNNGASWFAMSVSGITGMLTSRSLANCSGDFYWSGYDFAASNSTYIFRSILPNVPTVITNQALNVTDDKADCSLNLVKNGGDVNTTHGLCWSLNPAPSVSDQTVSTGTGLGIYTSTLFGLTPSTTYYVRAFATNTMGTSYGNEISFTTLVSTGILNNSLSNDLNIFPNPVQDILNLPFSQVVGAKSFQITDSNGKVIMSGELPLKENQIQLIDWPKGVYILKTDKGLIETFVKN